MTDLDRDIERAARAGYEKMIQLSGMFVNKHVWDKEPPELRDDWCKTAIAILCSYNALRKKDEGEQT